MLLSKKTFPSNFYVNFPVVNSTAKMNSNPFVLFFFPIWQFQKKFKQKYIIQVSLPWNESAAALLHLHSAFLCHTERTNIRFLFSNPSKATAKKVISLEFLCRSSRGLVGKKKVFSRFVSLVTFGACWGGNLSLNCWEKSFWAFDQPRTEFCRRFCSFIKVSKAFWSLLTDKLTLQLLNDLKMSLEDFNSPQKSFETFKQPVKGSAAF